MIFGCCFQTTITISAMLLSALTFIDAFQPYYYQQQHKNCIEQRTFSDIYSTSIIAYNHRQYLIDTLGFTEEKLDKIETTRKDEKGTILTLEIGVLDERVNLLKDMVST